MDLKLRDAKVLVTGGSRGIGSAIAFAFGQEGAKVAICGRDRGALEATERAIRAEGGLCLPLVADLTGPAAGRDVVERAAEALGGLDVLVNNASAAVVANPDSFEFATDEQLTSRLAGKTMPAVQCARAAIPHMRRAGGGRIVCIGGITARAVLRKDDSPFTGARLLPQGLGNSALAAFVKYLAEEVACDGILVNIIHPSMTRTERYPRVVRALAKERGLEEAEADAQLAASIPIGRVVQPSDITPLVLLLSSPLSGATTGQAIAVDGGSLRNVQY